MATYKIPFTTGASAYVQVEADSLDEALDAAYEKGFPGLCAQCAGGPGVYKQDYLELDDAWEPDTLSGYEVDGEYTVPGVTDAPANPAK